MKTVNLTAETYYMFTTMVFFLTGIIFFFYVLLLGINMGRLQVMSSPIFYLIMGGICMCFYIGARKGVVE